MRKEFKQTEKVNDIQHTAQEVAMQNAFKMVSVHRNKEHHDDGQAEADHFRAMYVDPTADEVAEEQKRVLRRQAQYNEEQKAYYDDFNRQLQNFKAVYRSAKCARRADHINVVCALNAQYLATYLHTS